MVSSVDCATLARCESRHFRLGETNESIHTAAADSSYEVLVLKMLVDANASLTEVDKNGDTVLHYAVRRRDPENVKS